MVAAESAVSEEEVPFWTPLDVRCSSPSPVDAAEVVVVVAADTAAAVA